jgi:hypothetical protein
VSNDLIRWVVVDEVGGGDIPSWVILKPITLIHCIEMDVVRVQSETFDKEASILEA